MHTFACLNKFRQMMNHTPKKTYYKVQAYEANTPAFLIWRSLYFNVKDVAKQWWKRSRFYKWTGFVIFQADEQCNNVNIKYLKLISPKISQKNKSLQVAFHCLHKLFRETVKGCERNLALIFTNKTSLGNNKSLLTTWWIVFQFCF